MTEPYCSWDSIYHRSFFLPKKMFVPKIPKSQDIYAIESKDFLPYRKVDFFKKPIPTPDSFEEGNMSNISPTIKVNISRKP